MDQPIIGTQTHTYSQWREVGNYSEQDLGNNAAAGNTVSEREYNKIIIMGDNKIKNKSIIPGLSCEEGKSKIEGT